MMWFKSHGVVVTIVAGCLAIASSASGQEAAPGAGKPEDPLAKTIDFKPDAADATDGQMIALARQADINILIDATELAGADAAKATSAVPYLMPPFGGEPQATSITYVFQKMCRNLGLTYQRTG